MRLFQARNVVRLFSYEQDLKLRFSVEVALQISSNLECKLILICNPHLKRCAVRAEMTFY